METEAQDRGTQRIYLLIAGGLAAALALAVGIGTLVGAMSGPDPESRVRTALVQCETDRVFQTSADDAGVPVAEFCELAYEEKGEEFLALWD